MENKARVHKRPLDRDEDSDYKIYKFKVFLPNGTSVVVTLRTTKSDIGFDEFVELVRDEYNYNVVRRSSMEQKRNIHWKSEEFYLKDTNDRKLTSRISLGNFKPHKCHILWLHDGCSENTTVFELEKEYQEWLVNMHEDFDEEIEAVKDNPITVFLPTMEKELGDLSNVIRVHQKVKKGNTPWKRDQKIKVLKGSCPEWHDKNLFATLEYFLFEWFQGDTVGGARIICRPMCVEDKNGCLLQEKDGIMCLDVCESLTLPISVIDSRKALPPEKVYAGHIFPTEIVAAVIRPANFVSSIASKSLEQKYIVKDESMMSLKLSVNYSGKDKDVKRIYSSSKAPSSRKGLHGLYIFQLPKILNLFQKAGVYNFVFSCKNSSCKICKKKVLVEGSPTAALWELLGNKQHKLSARVGFSIPHLSVACYDDYHSPIPFLCNQDLKIRLTANDVVLYDGTYRNARLSSDRMILKIEDAKVETKKLDLIRPDYAATLVICSQDQKLSVSVPSCQVYPGTLYHVRVRSPLDQNQLLPGLMVQKLTLEMFDAYGNHLKQGSVIEFNVNGFSIQGQQQKVDENGCVDLGGLVRVTAGYGKLVSLSVFYEGKQFFKQEYTTVKRELQLASKVSLLCGPKEKPRDFDSPCPGGKFMLFEYLQSAMSKGSFVPLNGEKMLWDDMEKYAQRNGKFESKMDGLEMMMVAKEHGIIELEDSLKREANLSIGLQYLLTKEEMMKEMEFMLGSAAPVLYLPHDISAKTPQDHFSLDVMGVVALLGTVGCPRLSKVLAEYLGEDQMLAVVCKSFTDAFALEKYDEHGEVDSRYGIHAVAEACGRCIKGRFHVFCLEDIKPYSGKLEGGTGACKKLALPDPMLEDGSLVPDFLGYAVNMVNPDCERFDRKTDDCLRKTLFYRLLGKLQVYRTRNGLEAALRCNCISDGAVSLDGGIVRRNGVISLGSGVPKISFPVDLNLSAQYGEMLSQKERLRVEVTSIKCDLEKLRQAWEMNMKKYKTRKRKLEEMIDCQMRLYRSSSDC